jgi:hypothetical protein
MMIPALSNQAAKTALLADQDSEVDDPRFGVYFFFRYLLAKWSHWHWTPRIFIHTLACAGQRAAQ